jgi:hypothetical protein
MMASCSGSGRGRQSSFVVKPSALVNIKSTFGAADLDLDLCLRRDRCTGAVEARGGKEGRGRETDEVADTRDDDADDNGNATTGTEELAGTATGAGVKVMLTGSCRSRRLGLHNNSRRKLDVDEFELSSSCSPRVGFGLPNSSYRKSEVSESGSAPASIMERNTDGRTTKACNECQLGYNNGVNTDGT